MLTATASNLVEKTPGVAGGSACLVRTRIPVWTLDQARRLGATEAQLLHSYPAITSEMLHAGGQYAAEHPEEIESEIEENERDYTISE
jgi:uncharacterized protein (DUF433 family)